MTKKKGEDYCDLDMSEVLSPEEYEKYKERLAKRKLTRQSKRKPGQEALM